MDDRKPQRRPKRSRTGSKSRASDTNERSFTDDISCRSQSQSGLHRGKEGRGVAKLPSRQTQKHKPKQKNASRAAAMTKNESQDERESSMQVTRNAVLQAISGLGPEIGLHVGKQNDDTTTVSDHVFLVRMRFPQSLMKEINSSSQKPKSNSTQSDAKQHFSAIMSDNKHDIQVLVRKTPELMNRLHRWQYNIISQGLSKHSSDQEMPKVDFLVGIRSFVATVGLSKTKARPQPKPLIFLTSIDIIFPLPTLDDYESAIGSLPNLSEQLEEHAAKFNAPEKSDDMKAKMNGKKPQTNEPSKKSAAKVYGGNSGSFLANISAFLTNGDLCGDSAIDLQPQLNNPSTADPGTGDSSVNSSEESETTTKYFESNVSKIESFLSRHFSMMAIKNASAGSHVDSGLAAPSDLVSEQTSTCLSSTQRTLEQYQSAINDFSTSQQDRQKASLTTNSGREDAARSAMVTSNYAAALEKSLSEEGALTPESICKWHGILLKDLHPNAGKCRSNQVRAGNTVFAPPQRVRKELEMMCKGLVDLEKRLSVSNNKRNVIHILLYSSVVMFCLVDVHPFQDGNGRMSRILANWAMRRAADLPFSFNLFATSEQRASYVSALEQTRHNLSLRCYGGATKEDLVEAIRYSGVFHSMVLLLADRLGRATEEFSHILSAKLLSKKEEEEERAARVVRERAAAGTCLICFESKPNIATLCCGRACHLNCIAEWLSFPGRNSCPVCRNELPPLSARPRPEHDDNADEADSLFGDDVVETTNSDDTTSLYSEGSNDDTTSLFAMPIRDSERRQEQEAWRILSSGGIEEALRTHMSQFRSSMNDAASETVDETSSLSSAGAGVAVSANANTEDTTTEIEVETSSPLVGSNQHFENGDEEATDDTTDTTTDDTNGDTTDVMPNEADAAMRDDTNTDTTDSDNSSTFSETENVPPPSSRPQLCCALDCKNRAAADCSNNLCGRCCIIGGTFACTRHGV